MKLRDDVAPCLILTATVQVKHDMAFVARRDTATRLDDYKGAFTRWVQTAGFPLIVYVENSGYDLSEFRNIAASAPEKRVEFLSFVCPPFDGSLGKGYGEMLCLKHCVANSEILRRAPRFFKVTGRYYLANAAALLQPLAERQDLDLLCNLEQNLTWADSRAFGASTEFLEKYFFPRLPEINDTEGSTFEQVLARACHAVMADRGSWAPLPEALQVHGVSGSIGDVFTPTTFTKMKKQIRHALYLRTLKGRG